MKLGKFLLIGLLLALSVSSWADANLRRCTLLPVVDSVGGAIGYKVFEKVEKTLKSAPWCTYISNSSMINIFSKYRENLPKYLERSELLEMVGTKLSVGSIVLLKINQDVGFSELEIKIYGQDGVEINFLESLKIETDKIEKIVPVFENWLSEYAKTIPYDARINGVIGEQITLDVGKGYPIVAGQRFVVKRKTEVKRHPLLKKIVEWNAEIVGDGKVLNISDNQAFAVVESKNLDKKVQVGDWVKLHQADGVLSKTNPLDQAVQGPGLLGIFSFNLLASPTELETVTASGTRKMKGWTTGFDLKIEGWLTRQYLIILETIQQFGELRKDSGVASKSSTTLNAQTYKVAFGYKYLPMGLFFGPQLDFYGGYHYSMIDHSYSYTDGFGKNNLSGVLLGAKAMVPFNREWRGFTKIEFLPFPRFTNDDNMFTDAKNVSSLQLEAGLKYQYSTRLTFDGSLEFLSRKARFNSQFRDFSQRDTFFKVGLGYNF